MADTTGVSKSTVHRVWKAFNIQPHRQKHFKLSTDPFFVDRRTVTARVPLSSLPR